MKLSKPRVKSAQAFAPATTGNVGVGFDILGLALDTVGDLVKVTRTKKLGHVEIENIIGLASHGSGLPTDPAMNTATAGIINLLSEAQADFGVRVTIKKGIPLGSGMGGSAASAVAGVVAANQLLPKPLTKDELMKYALVGEKVATGSVHGDNVAPCLFGGLVIVASLEPARIINVPVPRALHVVISLPNARLDTRDSRAVLKSEISMKDYVSQSARLAGFIAGCFENDLDLIKNSFEDLIIEPQRAHLIKGFTEVKSAALKCGALGCTISGAGPAIFALATEKSAPQIKAAMTKAFESAGSVPVKTWITKVHQKGARIV